MLNFSYISFSFSSSQIYNLDFANHPSDWRMPGDIGIRHRACIGELSKHFGVSRTYFNLYTYIYYLYIILYYSE